MTVRMESRDAGVGRVLDVLTGGTERGPALLMHHGTPSDATLWADSTSTRRPGRRVASVAADVAVMPRHLDIPWFVTAGWSGGGPHALSCC